MERRLRDSQFGFMPGRGVADAIFAVFELVWTCIGNRRIMCGQESDSDGDRGAVEETERKSEAQVLG